MNKLLIASAAFASLLASQAQAGIIHSKQGVVSQINIAAGSLVLANGEAYQMLNPALLYGFVPGDAVTVGYDSKNGHLIGRSLFRIPAVGSSNSGGSQGFRSQTRT
jgi:hypothetical protein